MQQYRKSYDMKKPYIRPTVEVIKVETSMLMACSNLNMNEGENINTDVEQFSREDNTINTPNMWDQAW